jgi:pimeloyl-ACP methyl ester carboxylesterase
MQPVAMPPTKPASGRLDRGDGVELAWTALPGRAPTVVFLPGFGSDMQGEKATALAAFCESRGQAMLRFDYSGHGISGGAFADGTISRWRDDALRVVDRLTKGPVVLVGSSMGGWIALLVALARPERVAGLVGIAAAPDFTQLLIWPGLSFAQRAALMERGRLDLPGRYGAAQVITRALIEDGRTHLVLGGPIPLSCPVRLLHGQRDVDVPWELALRTAEHMAGDDVELTLIKDGDHRLSRPRDLDVLRRTLEPLLGG